MKVINLLGGPGVGLEANAVKIQAGKNFYGNRYIVETELSFKIMVDEKMLLELMITGDLVFCNEKETERAKKAIKYYKVLSI